jgi:hypothetical protein
MGLAVVVMMMVVMARRRRVPMRPTRCGTRTQSHCTCSKKQAKIFHGAFLLNSR